MRVGEIYDKEAEMWQEAYEIGYKEGKKNAVPVVRCKDCYNSTDNPFIDNTVDCNILNIPVDENFYCKFGTKANVANMKKLVIR